MAEHPKSADALGSLADALYQAGKHAEAQAAYHKALTIKPDARGIRAKLEELEKTGRISPQY